LLELFVGLLVGFGFAGRWPSLVESCWRVTLGVTQKHTAALALATIRTLQNQFLWVPLSCVIADDD
jgi:hypothetical protein